MMILFDGTVGNSKPSNKLSVLKLFCTVDDGEEIFSVDTLSAIILNNIK